MPWSSGKLYAIFSKGTGGIISMRGDGEKKKA
jgi:hypothetical protein